MMVRNQLAQVSSDRLASPTNPPRAAIEVSHFEEEFGQFLVAGGVIDSLVLERARSAADKSDERLDRVLTKLGLVPEENLAGALSSFLSLPLARPNDVPAERVLPDIAS